MTYPIPSCEQERVGILRSLEILDTGYEQPYEDIVELAKIHFEVDMVLISLVDRHRQWFKSHLGLETRETDREDSLCTYTILAQRGELFEVTDALQEPAFRDNPLVAGPLGLRYYCGTPITVLSQNIGAFCLIDRRVRSPIDDQGRRFLVRLARMVGNQIQQRRLLQ